MTILIFKLLYGFYFFGIGFYSLHLLSMVVFSKLRFLVKIDRLFKGILIAFAWPIMLLSSGGIKTLKKNINKF